LILDGIHAVNVDHYGREAILCNQEGDHRRAQRLLHAGLQLRPDDPYLWWLMGNTLQELGEMDAARRAAQTATQGAPESWRAWNALAWIHIARREYREAELAFEQALGLGPELRSPLYGRALAVLAQREYGRAFSLYEQAVETTPPTPFDTIPRFDGLVENEPDLVFAYLIRGFLYTLLGNRHMAESDLERFVEDFEGDRRWISKAEELLALE
jgi:tetratricopeptide (TPR) repeat protein